MPSKKESRKNQLVVFSILLGIVPIFIICSIVLFTSGVALFTGGLMFFDGISDYLTWRDHTEPLSQEVIDDLCEKFELDGTDPRCDNSGDDIFGPDFFNDLQQNISSDINNGWTTYEDMNDKFGMYEFKREPIVKQEDGKEFFRCFYDFTGDKAYPFIVYYYTDGKIMRLIADVVD